MKIMENNFDFLYQKDATVIVLFSCDILKDAGHFEYTMLVPFGPSQEEISI